MKKKKRVFCVCLCVCEGGGGGWRIGLLGRYLICFLKFYFRIVSSSFFLSVSLFAVVVSFCCINQTSGYLMSDPPNLLLCVDSVCKVPTLHFYKIVSITVGSFSLNTNIFIRRKKNTNLLNVGYIN